MDKFVIPCGSSVILSDVIVCGAEFVDVVAFIDAAVFVGMYICYIYAVFVGVYKCYIYFCPGYYRGFCRLFRQLSLTPFRLVERPICVSYMVVICQSTVFF